MKRQETRDIPEGWKVTTLRELGEVNRGRSRFRPRYAEHLYGGPYPFIQTGDIKASGGRITKYSQTYSKAGLEQSRLWPAGTLCITIAANIAETAILSFPACFPDSIIGFIADEKKSDVVFIEYMFRYLKNRIQNEASGSVQDNINLQTLDNLEFPIPTLQEQKEIAAVLSSLDDKIELLRRQNKTLETIAQALFKRWFVDFEFPNEKGKPYKSSGGKMVDSELGKIPEGWRVGMLGDILSLEYGKSLKDEHRTGTGFPVYGSNGIIGYHRDYLVKGDGIVVGRKGTMGSVLWVEGDFYPIDTTFYVKDRLSVEKLYYHYYMLLSKDLGRLGSDSAVPGLNRNFVYAEECILPYYDVINIFHQEVDSQFNKIKLNKRQEGIVSVIRDLLLPKIVNGELRVRNVR